MCPYCLCVVQIFLVDVSRALNLKSACYGVSAGVKKETIDGLVNSNKEELLKYHDTFQSYFYWGMLEDFFASKFFFNDVNGIIKDHKGNNEELVSALKSKLNPTYNTLYWSVAVYTSGVGKENSMKSYCFPDASTDQLKGCGHGGAYQYWGPVASPSNNFAAFITWAPKVYYDVDSKFDSDLYNSWGNDGINSCHSGKAKEFAECLLKRAATTSSGKKTPVWGTLVVEYGSGLRSDPAAVGGKQLWYVNNPYEYYGKTWTVIVSAMIQSKDNAYYG